MKTCSSRRKDSPRTILYLIQHRYVFVLHLYLYNTLCNKTRCIGARVVIISGHESFFAPPYRVSELTTFTVEKCENKLLCGTPVCGSYCFRLFGTRRVRNAHYNICTRTIGAGGSSAVHNIVIPSVKNAKDDFSRNCVLYILSASSR